MTDNVVFNHIDSELLPVFEELRCREPIFHTAAFGSTLVDLSLIHIYGDDDAAKDGVVFAELLTRQMRDKSHDMHLVMEYSLSLIHILDVYKRQK